MEQLSKDSNRKFVYAEQVGCPQHLVLDVTLASPTMTHPTFYMLDYFAEFLHAMVEAAG